MLIIIDLMGEEETIVVGDEDNKPKHDPQVIEKIKREIMEREPQPQVIPITRQLMQIQP